MARNRWTSVSTKVTPSQLRAEGVLEVGSAGGSILFVLTRRKLHIIHNVINAEDRKLDDYAIQLAVNWIENGHRSFEVAGYLDVCPQHLQRSLEAAGYERLGPTDQERQWKVGMKQKLGNRRGKLVDVTAPVRPKLVNPSPVNSIALATTLSVANHTALKASDPGGHRRRRYRRLRKQDPATRPAMIDHNYD